MYYLLGLELSFMISNDIPKLYRYYKKKMSIICWDYSYIRAKLEKRYFMQSWQCIAAELWPSIQRKFGWATVAHLNYIWLESYSSPASKCIKLMWGDFILYQFLHNSVTCTCHTRCLRDMLERWGRGNTVGIIYKHLHI